MSPPPRNLFSGLMRIYETNYSLLRRLLAGNAGRSACSAYCPPGRYQLQPEPRSSQPSGRHQTATVILTYNLLNGQSHSLGSLVRLEIRLYHDTRQAEVLRPQRRPGSRRTGKRALEAKWAANSFLNSILLRLTTSTRGETK